MTKPRKLTEPELVEGLMLKEEKAFCYLYDNYSPSLYGVILCKVHDEEVAADLLQDVFIKVWEGMARYDATKGRLFTWLLTITNRTAIDYLRINKAQRHTQLDDSIGKVQSSNHADSIGVRDFLRFLAPERAELLTLVYFDHLTHKEAAQRLKIPHGTAKTRVLYAIRDLRVLLANDLVVA